MDWLIGALALLFLALAFLLAWRQARLCRRLEEYARLLRQSVDQASPSDALPLDAPGLEDLSNAVRALAAAFQERLLEVDA